MSNIKENVKWGIIGCGDVCEIKSGPAFQKVDNSELVAVMRRDPAKAQDFAERHHVPRFYADAQALIGDPEVNAIYIATPPATHEAFAIEAMAAAKPVYIEKPLSIDSTSTKRIAEFAKANNIKASGAYYRRGLPLFKKVKELVLQGALGDVSLISIQLLLPPSHNGIAQTEENWRINPELSGGGLFHDLAPHMLDIIYWIFGEPTTCSGGSMNQAESYDAPDYTFLNAALPGNKAFTGIWAFNVSLQAKTDSCKLIGNKGYLEFSFFDNEPLKVVTDTINESFTFQNPENIQINLIQDVVKFFRGEGNNPCSIEDTLVSMKMMDATMS